MNVDGHATICSFVSLPASFTFVQMYVCPSDCVFIGLWHWATYFAIVSMHTYTHPCTVDQWRYYAYSPYLEPDSDSVWYEYYWFPSKKVLRLSGYRSTGCVCSCLVAFVFFSLNFPPVSVSNVFLHSFCMFCGRFFARLWPICKCATLSLCSAHSRLCVFPLLVRSFLKLIHTLFVFVLYLPLFLFIFISLPLLVLRGLSVCLYSDKEKPAESYIQIVLEKILSFPVQFVTFRAMNRFTEFEWTT